MSRRRLRKVIYDLERRQGPIGQAVFRAALASYRLCDSVFLRRGTRPDLVSEKLLLRDARVLFVGVPKVATRSLIEALTSLPADVGKPEFLELDVESLLRRHAEVRDYFKFTFVRNPWSRATSCYLEKIKNEHPIKQARHLHNRRGLEAGMPFEAFAEWLNSREGSDDFADRHWMSQHRILANDRPDLIKYDFIGRFERLAGDFNRLRALTGLLLPELSHKLQTQSPDQYKTLYSKRTIELIARRYARDIEMFGYDFHNVQ